MNSGIQSLINVRVDPSVPPDTLVIRNAQGQEVRMVNIGLPKANPKARKPVLSDGARFLIGFLILAAAAIGLTEAICTVREPAIWSNR